MGLSNFALARLFFKTITLLLLLLTFIFLGIQAFTSGDTVGMVVNSLMPVAAALGMGGGEEEKGSAMEGDDEDGEEEQDSGDVSKTVSDVMNGMKARW